MSSAAHIATRPYGAMAPDVETFAFSPENQEEVARILARYPAERQQSAMLPLLLLAQEQHGGWLPQAAMDHVAELLNVAKIIGDRTFNYLVPLTMVGALYLILTLIASAGVRYLDARLPRQGLPLR